MRVDGALLRELAELLSANDLTEIEVEDGDRKIRVRREAAQVGGALSPAQIAAFGMLNTPPSPVTASAMPASPAPITSETTAAPVDAVKSPMVGTGSGSLNDNVPANTGVPTYQFSLASSAAGAGGHAFWEWGTRGAPASLPGMPASVAASEGTTSSHGTGSRSGARRSKRETDLGRTTSGSSKVREMSAPR